MADISFVRTEMLPEKTPPATSVGLIGWIRENLFSGWFNSVLTVLSLAFVYYVLASILPWIFQSSWTANSLNECREAISATYGEGTSGACWAVVRERYLQLIYGFYPDHLYWRPNLASVLTLGALAPILFSSLPRKMLWLAVIAPFAVPWLLWGGTIWTPVSAAAGFAIGFVAYRVLSEAVSNLVGVIGGLIAALVWWQFVFSDTSGPLSSLSSTPGLIANGIGLAAAIAVFVLLSRRTDQALSIVIAVAFSAAWWAMVSPSLAFRIALIMGDNFASIGGLEFLLSAAGEAKSPVQWFNQVMPLELEPVESRNFGGFMLSITIGVTGIVCSLPIGIVLALGRQSNLLIVRGLCIGFIEFIRGVPLITLLFVASTLLNIFMPPGTNFDIILRVMIMVTVFASAYMAEVVRGGLAALPKGQYEGADSLGLNYWQAQRLIIMPQALKISIPGIVSTFIGMFKDTTLVSIIGLMDPLGLSNAIRADANWNGIVWELYGFIALMFFVFCFSMSRYSMYLERKLQTGHR